MVIFRVEPLEMHISSAVKPQSVSQEMDQIVFILLTKIQLLTGLYMVTIVQGSELPPERPVFGITSGGM